MPSRVLFPAASRAFRPLQRVSRPVTFSFAKLASTSTDSSVINSNMSQNGEAAPDDVPEKDKWKYRAPYRIHEKNEGFDTKHEGQCHCGKVKFQLSREAPLASKLCHCTTCQLQHAAPFQWAAIFHKEDINFESGHHNLEWYDPTTKSIEHQLPCKVRCAYCHSPIMDEGRNMILLFPSLIKLETQKAKDDFKPQCHMFYPQRLMDIPDGVPKWTGINKESELMDEPDFNEVQNRERKRQKKQDESGRPVNSKQEE